MTTSLQDLVIQYLESKGWYFDWGYASDWKSVYGLKNRGEALRTMNAWTLPYWGEYWMKPYSDNPDHENFGAPKSRRYEDLKTALWSQISREENPENFAIFFDGFEKEYVEPKNAVAICPVCKEPIGLTPSDRDSWRTPIEVAAVQARAGNPGVPVGSRPLRESFTSPAVPLAPKQTRSSSLADEV